MRALESNRWGIRNIKAALLALALLAALGTAGRAQTSGAPFLVKEINTAAGAGSDPENFTMVGSTVFFTANDGVTGTELWKSDGTAGGTIMVKDIKLGSGGSGPNGLTAWNGKLYFAATDATHQNALWCSDGTAAGTVKIKGVKLEKGYRTEQAKLVEMNGNLYFFGTDSQATKALWKSDGTAFGTAPVCKSDPATVMGVWTDELVATNGNLIFQGSNFGFGIELWKSNGTEAGTVLVKDIDPGSGNYASSWPENMTVMNNMVFFVARDGQQGYQLFRSDGTELGTVKLTEPSYATNPPTLDRFGFFHPCLTPFQDRMYFQARDMAVGFELWRSDGTRNGTALFKDLEPGGGWGASPESMTVAGKTMFFETTITSGSNELWTSDGTVAGTRMVKAFRLSPGPRRISIMTGRSSRAYFAADDGIHGIELWESDGTEAGTRLVGEIAPGAEDSSPASLLLTSNMLYFSASAGAAQGRELWAARIQRRTGAQGWMRYHDEEWKQPRPDEPAEPILN